MMLQLLNGRLFITVLLLGKSQGAKSGEYDDSTLVLFKKLFG